jgi:ParB-like chromosome segregation protein Spo0J
VGMVVQVRSTASEPGVPGPPGVLSEPVVLEIDSLLLDGSPRLQGENETHTRALARADTALPPVLVHRQVMRVLDGIHRVQAARLRGETKIQAVLFDGDAEAAFVYAVKANVSHGLLLSLADRRAAALRMVSSFPEWSDRAVAASSGLSHTTVSAIRGRTTGSAGQLNTRVGRDGRVRPIPAGAAAARRRAASMLAARPAASLREVARSTGVSVGTAHDVRRRIDNGEDPVPGGVRHSARRTKAPATVLESLKKDPSLRYTEVGRRVVRWLDTHFIDPDALPLIADRLPPHCSHTIAELARGYADAWERLAQQLQAGTNGGG